MAACTLALGACTTASTPGTARYTLTFHNLDEAKETETLEAVERVARNVAQSLGKTPQDITVQKEGTGAVLSLKLPDEASVTALSDVITKPFSLRVMYPVPAEQGDITVEESVGNTVGYKETGITEQHMAWVVAAQMPNSNFGEVRLDFTKDGRILLLRVLEANKGKQIGLFVRNRLVSVMNVTEQDLTKENVVISNIPSFDVAKIFADDVNVGLHVTFDPIEKE